jgi:hypothetical protein
MRTGVIEQLGATSQRGEKLGNLQHWETMSTQEMETKMDVHQEKMEAMIPSIWSKLEETIKHRVEDVLSCVSQRTQGLITS